jgi:hypothetical protein
MQEFIFEITSSQTYPMNMIQILSGYGVVFLTARDPHKNFFIRLLSSEQSCLQELRIQNGGIQPGHTFSHVVAVNE